MRILGDIPIGCATREFLKACGHDVINVRDRLPPTASDPDIIRLAVAEDRIVLCFDLDMAGLVALSREYLPSVITLRTSRQSAEYVNKRLLAILPDIESESARGALVTVEDHRVRIRELPVAPPNAR